MKYKSWLAVAAAMCLFGSIPAWAHLEDPSSQIMAQVHFDQKLNQRVPLDLPFRDEEGHVAPLSAYMKGKPVILSLIYYNCSQLCFLDTDEIVHSMKGLPFKAGNEFNVISVSIDPNDTPALAMKLKNDYMKKYGMAASSDGWHFLTGDQNSIARLADAIGYHFAYDAQQKDYAHPDGIAILTPEGKISHYFFLLDYPSRDLKFALMEAASGRIGSKLEYFALSCYHYNPTTGKYSLAVMNLVRLAGILTVVMMAVLIGSMLRWEKQGKEEQEKKQIGSGRTVEPGLMS